MNPAVSQFKCSFTLASLEAARLEVFDTAGRRVCERKVEHATAGPHFEALSTAGLGSGVYMIRLTQAGLTATTRVVILK